MITDYIFKLTTPLELVVRSTQKHWRVISTVKHPVMADRLEQVRETLTNPDVIHQSRIDDRVLLFYKRIRVSCWICAVVKKLNGEGFLITAYPTENIKEGIEIWKR